MKRALALPAGLPLPVLAGCWGRSMRACMRDGSGAGVCSERTLASRGELAALSSPCPALGRLDRMDTGWIRHACGPDSGLALRCSPSEHTGEVGSWKTRAPISPLLSMP